MRHLKQSSSRLMMIAIIILMVVAGGCKSKKKAMEARQAAEEKARIEQEAALQKQKQEEEARKRAEEEEQARLQRESDMKTREPKAKLQEYFQAITGAGSAASANSSIQEALTLFSSEETPVLIVIHEENGQKDYDKPTTIKQYLNYIKDVKKSPDKIGEIQFDSAGKIKELELVKQK
jgi:membrane-associated HD superfamily phosphohydrolase